MTYSAKGFFETNEGMVQILLMLKIRRILRLKICSVVLLPALNPACSSTIISSALAFKPSEDDFQHNFARMTDLLIVL